jgi:hypothetical protein
LKGFSLWRAIGELQDGAELEWNSEHGDEAIYVRSGILVCNDTRTVDGSTLIIEAGVPTVIRSVGVTEVLHFGTVATTARSGGLFGQPATEGRGIHDARSRDTPAIQFGGGDGATSVYFADGTCPTCRITFFLYDGSVFADGYQGVSHFHSEDEIMHVLEGELRVGALTVTPGACLAVPQNVRYSFRTPGPFRYLDYRADVSTAVVEPGSVPVLETVANLKAMGGAGSARANRH